MTQARRGEAAQRRDLAVGFFVCWAVLCALQLGWGAGFAWGYNLWQYFPAWAFGLLLGVSFALVFPSAREWLRSGARRLQERCSQLPGARAVGLVAIFLALWVLRERQLYGDSHIFMWETGKGSLFLFPDLGASFLLGELVALGRALSDDPLGQLLPLQIVICLAGTATVAFVFRANAYMAPTWQGRATLLILSGGLLRVFAGHVEVYAFLLVAVAAYWWAAMAHLAGRNAIWVPSLILGVAIWLHFAALCLVPSLLVLTSLGQRGHGGRTTPALAVLALGVTAIPVVTFLVAAAIGGASQDFAQMGRVVRELFGSVEGPHGVERWIRGWTHPDGSVGTAYVLLSPAHLKYLVNAAHVLSPVAAPILVAALLLRPRALCRGETGVFLASCCIPLGLYALLLRPVWGPFDWDLFCVTAFFFTVWAGWVMDAARETASWDDTLTWLIASTAVFVTIPFLLIAPGSPRDAGPFGGVEFNFDLLQGSPDPAAPIAPWL